MARTPDRQCDLNTCRVVAITIFFSLATGNARDTYADAFPIFVACLPPDTRYLPCKTQNLGKMLPRCTNAIALLQPLLPARLLPDHLSAYHDFAESYPHRASDT